MEIGRPGEQDVRACAMRGGFYLSINLRRIHRFHIKSQMLQFILSHAKRPFYEWIPDSTASLVRHYFDFEKVVPEAEATSDCQCSCDALVSDAILGEYGKLARPVIMTSHGRCSLGYKYSYRVIIPSTSATPSQISTIAHRLKSHVDFIDTTVYTDRQHIRSVMCHKDGQARSFMPPLGADPIDCFIQTGRPAVNIPTLAPLHREEKASEEQRPAASRRSPVQPLTAHRHDKALLIDYLREASIQGRVVRIESDARGVLAALDSRFCEIARRQHKSNHVYLTAWPHETLRGYHRVWQRCRSAECVGKHAAQMHALSAAFASPCESPSSVQLPSNSI